MPHRPIAAAAAVLAALGANDAEAEPKVEFLAASEVAMAGPQDLTLDGDGSHLYVADAGNDRIAVLDPHSLVEVGAFGDRLDAPHDIYVAGERVFVADTGNDRVVIYQMSGLTASLAGVISGGFRGPEGVLAHPNGRVYVAGTASGNVVAYEDGAIVAELDGLSSPHDLELSPEGDIWVSDAGNDRMLLLSPELGILAERSGPPFEFAGVRYQDVLADGTVIAADTGNHQVKVIAPDGALLLAIGGAAGEAPGQFRAPEGVEAAGDRLWVSDSGNDRVVRYSFRRD